MGICVWVAVSVGTIVDVAEGTLVGVSVGGTAGVEVAGVGRYFSQPAKTAAAPVAAAILRNSRLVYFLLSTRFKYKIHKV